MGRTDSCIGYFSFRIAVLFRLWESVTIRQTGILVVGKRRAFDDAACFYWIAFGMEISENGRVSCDRLYSDRLYCWIRYRSEYEYKFTHPHTSGIVVCD